MGMHWIAYTSYENTRVWFREALIVIAICDCTYLVIQFVDVHMRKKLQLPRYVQNVHPMISTAGFLLHFPAYYGPNLPHMPGWASHCMTLTTEASHEKETAAAAWARLYWRHTYINASNDTMQPQICSYTPSNRSSHMHNTHSWILVVPRAWQDGKC